MRVYFLSYRRAALKLNGQYLGIIDSFDRHTELNLSDDIFAEILPADNAAGVNFTVNEKFFENPPDFADVFLTDGDALIYIKKYENKNAGTEVLFQTRFNGTLVTVFSQGDVFLSCDGAEFTLKRLPDDFRKCTDELREIGGRRVLSLRGGNFLCIIAESGKVLFLNEVVSAEYGETLKISAQFETCAAARAECTFVYDGDELRLTESRTAETRDIDDSVLHFAFFESVLTRGDCAKYLSDELRPQAAKLREYLGAFTSVTIPTEKYCALHGDVRAAGLVYPVKDNLFRIKYFITDVTDGKITNVYPSD